MDIPEKKKLGQILTEKGFINLTQLQQALDEQKSKSNVPLGQILLELGYITPEQLDQALKLQKEQSNTAENTME